MNLTYSLTNLQGFITGRASMVVARTLQRNFKNASLEITHEQFAVLSILWEKDGLSQQEISSISFKDKPSITRLIDNMEKLNLVVRILHQNDRRTNLIYLTAKGRQIEEHAKKIANETLQEALKGLSQEKIDICKEVLAQVFNNLS